MILCWVNYWRTAKYIEGYVMCGWVYITSSAARRQWLLLLHTLPRMQHLNKCELQNICTVEVDFSLTDWFKPWLTSTSTQTQATALLYLILFVNNQMHCFMLGTNVWNNRDRKYKPGLQFGKKIMEYWLEKYSRCSALTCTPCFYFCFSSPFYSSPSLYFHFSHLVQFYIFL